MVRPKRIRRISFKPEVTYFKPAGIPITELEEVVLTFDELEALRLMNIEEIEQKEVAKKMDISQPTLSRLVQSARKKVTEAIINGYAIKVQGGHFKMVRPRGRGLRRGTVPGQGRGRMGGVAAGPGGTCVCPKCGYKEQQIRGKPCISKVCPKCKTKMIRG